MKKRTLAIAILSLSYTTYGQGNGNGNNGAGGQKWSTSGNQASSNDYIGTSNQQSLIFKTNSLENMRLLPNGNFGIGTSSPNHTLSVNGTIQSMVGGFMFPDGTIQATAAGQFTQMGTQNNPFSELYAVDFLKIGNNSMYLTGPTAPTSVGGTAEHEIYVSDDDLFIQCKPAGFVPIGGTPGRYNTLINAGPSDGNVGIGVNIDPKAKLELELKQNNYSEAGIRITAPVIYNGSTTLPLIGSPDQFHIRKGNNNGAYETQFVVKSNGNTGVSTYNPDAPFNVENGNGSGIDSHLEGFTLLDGSQASLLLGGQTGAAYGEWGIEYNALADGLNFWKPAGATTFPGTNWHLFIKNTGEISMGFDPTDSSNPKNLFNGNYKLYVAQGILTEKVKVALRDQSEWADYVFDEDYELMPLEEVNTFIQTNKHLPGVPSAEEMVETGLNVAEMDAKLLEKIEELTLYMIELKKENEAIRKENEAIKEALIKMSSK